MEERIRGEEKVSIMKTIEEKQRSATPNWNLPPDVREYHYEQDESSR